MLSHDQAGERPRRAVAADLADAFSGRSPAERLIELRRRVQGRILFTTSFGLEDQALTHMIFDAGLDIAILTLDTGRLFPETYELWAATERRYGARIPAVYPRAEQLEALVETHGVNGFYMSAEIRKTCCGVRKVEPLRRALANAEVWVTGLRGGQSFTRDSMALVAFDDALGVIKANPLLDRTREDLLAFATRNDVPLSPLHGEGFLSIGCAPCTRAIRPGEPERAGRWWWEDEAKKECGLHLAEDYRPSQAGAAE